MRNSFLYLTLALGLICWGVTPGVAKDDSPKLSKAEKRELKKKEKEAKKAARKKAKDNDKEAGDDDDDKDKKVDKKAVSKAMKALAPDYGKAKGNGKFYMYVDYTILTEEGEEMLNKLAEAEKDLKKAKVNVLLINGFSAEEEMPEAIKYLKSQKIKYPMIRKTEKLAEELPGYSGGTAPAITIVTPGGQVKASGGAALVDTWHEAVGAKITKKAAAEDEPEEESAE